MEGNIDDPDVQFPVGMRVLTVDNNPICLRVLETMLRKCQYNGSFSPLNSGCSPRLRSLSVVGKILLTYTSIQLDYSERIYNEIGRTAYILYHPNRFSLLNSLDARCRAWFSKIKIILFDSIIVL